MEPTEFLKRVDTLAKQGLTQKQIAQEMGFKTPFTLNSRLVRASQGTGNLFLLSDPVENPSSKSGSKP